MLLFYHALAIFICSLEIRYLIIKVFFFFQLYAFVSRIHTAARESHVFAGTNTLAFLGTTDSGGALRFEEQSALVLGWEEQYDPRAYSFTAELRQKGVDNGS